MAKPMGMPMAAQRKKLASIRAAEKLTADASQIVPPVPAEEAIEADGRADDGADHEDGEAGIDDVQPDDQDRRVLVGDEADQQARRGEDRKAPLPCGAERGVEHVEGDVLAHRHDRPRREEDDPDIGDGADLEGPGDRIVEDVARDHLEHEGDEHGREQRRREQLRPPVQAPYQQHGRMPLSRALKRERGSSTDRSIGCRLSPYLSAWLICSSRPFGQLAANFESENSFSTWLRKASTSGVVTFTPLPSKKLFASASVFTTPSSLKALALASAASIAAF